jgi:hypothetical protein
MHYNKRINQNYLYDKEKSGPAALAAWLTLHYDITLDFLLGVGWGEKEGERLLILRT